MFFNAAQQTWVLHRKLVVRAVAAVLCAALIGFLFQGRGGIMMAIGGVGEVLKVEMALSSFGLSEIAISGQVLTAEAQVVQALALHDNSSTLSFDAEGARRRLLELPAVSAAVIRKRYPNKIDVTLTEREPVARWRLDGVTYLIDGSGEAIGVARSETDAELPLVVGDGAADDAHAIIRALRQHAALWEDLMALSRIADRRWDMIYWSGLRVQLPEMGINQALSDLARYQQDYALLQRDIELLDLRLPDMIAVRPVDRASPTEQIEESVAP